ncbi:MAG: triose-phosphate isomerase [Gaiellales bacterium]|nr:MAG: triose-phosphate isomerase [Gaiellales bacterium]
MSSRKPVIAGNWKMHKTMSEAVDFTRQFLALVTDVKDVEIVLGPPFTSLSAVLEVTASTPVRVAAQNMHFEQSGAFTGEISPPMLKELGVDDVILGHSERREYNAENDSDLAKKVVAAFASGIRPILCVGESEDEREGSRTEEKLGEQLRGDLSGIDADQLAAMVIAYEPIWAIGTGKTATPEIAQQTIAFIRTTVTSMFGSEAAQAVRILYGGSVKPDNISELMAQDDIDGALVGGACLEAGSFASIVRFQ